MIKLDFLLCTFLLRGYMNSLLFQCHILSKLGRGLPIWNGDLSHTISTFRSIPPLMLHYPLIPELPLLWTNFIYDETLEIFYHLPYSFFSLCIQFKRSFLFLYQMVNFMCSYEIRAASYVACISILVHSGSATLYLPTSYYSLLWYYFILILLMLHSYSWHLSFRIYIHF